MAWHRLPARWLLVPFAALLALSLPAHGAGAATLLKLKTPAVAMPAGDLLSAGCGGGFVAQGWTVTLLRDGTLSQSSYGPGKPKVPPQTATVPAPTVAAMFQKAAKLTEAQMPHAGGEVGCGLVVTLNGQTLDGRFPYTLGTQPPPPKPKPAERVFLDLVALAKTTFGTTQ